MSHTPAAESARRAGHSMDCPPQAPWHPGIPGRSPGCAHRRFLPYQRTPSVTAVSPVRLAKKWSQNMRHVDLIPWQRKSVRCLLGKAHLMWGRVGECLRPRIFWSLLFSSAHVQAGFPGRFWLRRPCRVLSPRLRGRRWARRTPWRKEEPAGLRGHLSLPHEGRPVCRAGDPEGAHSRERSKNAFPLQ